MTFSSVIAFVALQEASKPSEAARPAARRVHSRPRLDVWRRFLTWRQRRATRIVLSALDDRMLRDIGVARSEIDAIASSMEIPKGR